MKYVINLSMISVTSHDLTLVGVQLVVNGAQRGARFWCLSVEQSHVGFH